MNSPKLSSQTIGLVALLVAATGTLTLVLPHVKVDRMQEDWYMGVPYRLIEAGHATVSAIDPFLENGPQAVYPPTAIAYRTGSLKLMRFYQFLSSLVVLGMLFSLFFRKFRDYTFAGWEVALYVVIFLATWISIPLALVYPIQINGMTPGFACLLLGILVYPRSAIWGMFCFGWAFTFKGQFLALLPGFMAYLFFVDVREATVGKHLLKSCAALAMFFVPKTILLAGLWQVLGLFPDKKELWLYAIDGPHLIFTEFQFILGRLLGRASSAAPEEGTRRAIEYAGFGLITWGHIYLSVIFCAFFSLRSLWKRIRTSFGRDLKIDSGLTAFAWGGLFYWMNYLFFYRFPYWYNVFAVIFLNLFLASACLHMAAVWVSGKWGKRWGTALLLMTALLACRFYFRDLRRECTSPMGTALTPYEWMRPSH